MVQILSFNRAYYQRFATRFVDLYEDDGPISAVKYAHETIKREDHPTAKEFITEEFKSRGYTFRGDEVC